MSSRPVFWWAGVGFLCLALQFFVYGSWILSPEFRPTDPGPDPIPEHSRIAMIVFHALSLGSLPFVLRWFVKGIRERGRIDAPRLMMIGWRSAYWLDPWLDFLRPMFTYNAYLVNFGCWCEFIPGWQAPRGARIAEPILVDPVNYFQTFTATALAGLWTMRRAKERWTALGTFGMALAALPGIWVAMGILDVYATRVMHFDAWPGSKQALSFWGGEFYQLPAYEFLVFPGAFIACAFLLYHTDMQGLTAIERGVERVPGPPWRRTSLRVLAFVAFCNVVNLAYATTLAVHTTWADPWPANMPSWLTNEQCGPLTGRECPDSLAAR